MSKNLITGRVSSVTKNGYNVLVNGMIYKTTISGRFRYLTSYEEDYPLTGDYVQFRETNELEGIIERVLDRSNTIKRLSVSPSGGAQYLASNIDLIFVCMSMNKDFNIKKLNNLINITYQSNCETVILLTKKDLCENHDYYINQVEKITESEVMLVSLFDEDSVNEIKNKNANKTSVLIGSSGVGKSSIVNMLLNREELATKEIRESDAQGRHTTSHRELFELENGGFIIDTPGIRIIYSYDVDNVDEHFDDITDYSKQCSFRDCTHNHEPGCAVIDAVNEGELENSRLEAYNRLQRYNKYAQNRIKLKTRNNKGR